MRMVRRRRLFAALVAFLAMRAPAALAGSVDDRLEAAAQVTQELAGNIEGIPQPLLDDAVCVVVLPSVKKLALGIGGSYGRGAMACRGGRSHSGQWGPPAMFRLEGGSIGFQIGGQATDLILLVMNQRGLKALLGSKVKLGAEVSVAAGPVGRSAAAATDVSLRAEILGYSRSKGLFAGISLEGSTLRQDGGANRELYGMRDISARDILYSKAPPPTPRAAAALIAALDSLSPRRHPADAAETSSTPSESLPANAPVKAVPQPEPESQRTAWRLLVTAVPGNGSSGEPGIGLEQSVRDLRRSADEHGLAVVDDEAAATIWVEVRERHSSRGEARPDHSTEESVRDLTVAVYRRGSDDGWARATEISTDGCCRWWDEAADRVIERLESWLAEPSRGR